MRILLRIINFMLRRKCRNCSRFTESPEIMHDWLGMCGRTEGWWHRCRPEDIACEHFKKKDVIWR
jgi:hypothetical protein